MANCETGGGKRAARAASILETLEIMADTELFEQIMRAAKTLNEDIREGKLHSFEEAFSDSPG